MTLEESVQHFCIVSQSPGTGIARKLFVHLLHRLFGPATNRIRPLRIAPLKVMPTTAQSARVKPTDGKRAVTTSGAACATDQMFSGTLDRLGPVVIQPIDQTPIRPVDLTINF